MAKDTQKQQKFIPEVCKLKHDHIDKDIDKIKNNIEKFVDDGNEQHEEIKEMITGLSHDVSLSFNNLKNKIVLTEKTMGDKIDKLNKFDEKLRGNGDPGIWESVRTIKRNIKIMMWAVAIILILALGGNYRGISLKSIRETFGIEDKPSVTEVITTTNTETETTSETTTEIKEPIELIK